MNLLVIIFSLASLLGSWVEAAPAVTSVHVSFVSGNKKTQYSHGSHTRPAVVQYNLEQAGTRDNRLHNVQRRSISDGDVTRVPKLMRGRNTGHQSTILLVAPTSTSDIPSSPRVTSEYPLLRQSTTTKASGNEFVTVASKTKRRYRGPSPLTFRTTTGYATDTPVTIQKRHKTNTRYSHSMPTATLKKSGYLSNKKVMIFGEALKSSPSSPSPTSSSTTTQHPRVRFMGAASPSSIPMTSTSTTSAAYIISPTMTKPSATTADITNHKKPKDTKAVKRSPYIENFESRGITFPDFDEFGGNEFGALRNFIGPGGSGASGGGRGSIAAHTHANPESLSPDGVFLPPLPTEASDYAEDSHHSHRDPYLADPETAKYAAQHPPFFAAFPHKRTVLDLNERRVEQGLEPNILRSIRPFFAFFESANPHRLNHARPRHHSHAPPPPPSSPASEVVAEVHGHPHLLHDHVSFGEGSTGTSPPSSSNHLGESFSVFNEGGHEVVVVNNGDHHSDPNLLLYTQSLLNNPASVDVAEAWNLFPHKKKKK